MAGHGSDPPADQGPNPARQVGPSTWPGTEAASQMIASGGSAYAALSSVAATPPGSTEN